LFLNPDIRLSPDGLSKSLYFIEDPKNELTGIVGIKLLDNCNVQRNTARFPSPKSLFYQMLGLDRLWPSRFPAHFMTNWDHKETREVDQVSGAFFLVRHQVFEELRGFDERFFMYYEDLDFAYRAKQAGWKSYYFAEAQAYHKGGGTSNQVKAKRLFYILRSRAYYIAKHFGYMEAVKIIIFSFIIELWVRIIWSLVNLSGTAILETLQAYLMFVREIPKLSRRIKNNSE